MATCREDSTLQLPLEDLHTEHTAATQLRLVRVALPVPLDSTFDYVMPDTSEPPSIGCRVVVPFGRGRKLLVGVIVEIPRTAAVDMRKLRPVKHLVDPHDCPIVSEAQLQLFRFTASYYHRGLGEVIQTALPAKLRSDWTSQLDVEVMFSLSEKGRSVEDSMLKRAPKQRELMKILRLFPAGITREELTSQLGNVLPIIRTIEAKGWITKTERDLVSPMGDGAPPEFELSDEQRSAISMIDAVSQSGFGTVLVDGVTGGGKTEVYLQCAVKQVQAGRQVLFLVPEIGLTPQTLDRVKRRIPGRVAAMHSGLSDHDRAQVYLRAAGAEIDCIVGTRSAIFSPMPNLGLIIVDEEHDQSLKQSDKGPRYSARDIAIVRGNQSKVPVVLGSATPSLETLHGVDCGRVKRATLSTRATGALPTCELIDTQSVRRRDAITDPLADAVRATLDRGEQALLFLNRRGFAPLVICGACKASVECHHCTATLCYHRDDSTFRCHHCQQTRPAKPQCPSCGTTALFKVGDGTQRAEQELRRRFPKDKIIRVDRDITSAKGSFEAILKQIMSGEPCILIGTQMLSLGHDFPNVTLTGFLSDAMLRMTDFRADERFAQTLIQVSGRAGRGSRPGQVLIQTDQPDTPVLQALLNDGYEGFARLALAERRNAGFPPYRHMAAVRAESADEAAALSVAGLLSQLEPVAGVDIIGPMPAAIEKVNNRHRYLVLMVGDDRSVLRRQLLAATSTLRSKAVPRHVRTAVDVDPVSLY